ncbi:MAG: hypothetical protein HQL96_17575 [Magnetococcales bacterium]|nr:hypothetical protein [Magnetococcales bacterium]
MINEGRVTRADIDKGSLATDKGVRIGTPTAEIRKKYSINKITKQRDPYTGGQAGDPIEVRVYSLDPETRDNKLLFTTRTGKITKFRAGKEPYVDYIEGCL